MERRIGRKRKWEEGGSEENWKERSDGGRKEGDFTGHKSETKVWYKIKGKGKKLKVETREI